MQSRQSGITMISFIVLLIIVGFFAFMAMKLVPPYMDYFGVSKAMDALAAENLDNKSQRKIREDFMFKLSMQYSGDTVTPDDIKFVHVGGGTEMDVAYDQRVHFIYNIDFLLHFEKSVKLQGNLY